VTTVGCTGNGRLLGDSATDSVGPTRRATTNASCKPGRVGQDLIIRRVESSLKGQRKSGQTGATSRIVLWCSRVRSLPFVYAPNLSETSAVEGLSCRRHLVAGRSAAESPGRAARAPRHVVASSR